MPRLSLAVPAALLLTGLAIATAVAQGIPGVPMVIDDGQAQKAPKAEAPKPKGELLDRMAAVVGEGIVTESALQEAISAFLQDEVRKGKKPPPVDKLRAPILDSLITQSLLLQRAERAKITVDDEELLKIMSEVAKDHGMTLEQLPDALKAAGADYNEYREDARKQVIISRLQQREVIRHINVSPRELDQFIERLKKLPNDKDEFDVSDILITLPEGATKAELDAQEKKAQDVYKLTATEDFARLALTNSAAQTALQGGALGWRKGANLPTDLAEAIVALKPGEISKPFLTPNGWHIVKLNDVRRDAGDPMKDQVHIRHILMKPDAVQDAATVRQKLSGFRQKILDGEDFGVYATRYTQDTGSQGDGGELEWLSPDAFDDPAFVKVVKELKDNEISEPFQTQHGWHIVQLLGRRKFDTTDDNLRQRAFTQLRDNKAEEEIDLWMRQLRDEAYIEIVDYKS